MSQKMNNSSENCDDDDQLSVPTSGSEDMFSEVSPNNELQLAAPLIVSNIQNISKDIKTLNLEKRHRFSCNIKEKIVIALDISKDEDQFLDNNDRTYIPLALLKKCVERFVQLKSTISKQHEYALVLLEENKAKWQLDFTSNPKEIIKALNSLSECATEDIFDLTSLFQEIHSRIRVPEIDENNIPPPYTVRVVLIYNRSYTCPKIKMNKTVKDILKSPFFTFDVLVTHRPIDAANNCEKIFDAFQNIDKKGFSYFFSVGRDMNTLMKSMGKLLGHPLQRPLQDNADYSFT